MLIGATAADTAANLVAAVTIGTGAGSLYSLYATVGLVATVSLSGLTLTTSGLPGENSNGLNLQSVSSAFSWDAAASGGTAGGVATQTFAESSNISSGASYQWEYTTGGTTLSQTAGQTPLAAGETLFVEYQPIGFGVVTVDNRTEIAARQAAEGGSGIYENITIRTDLLTTDDGVAAAQTLLANNDSMVDTVQIDTDVSGLLPGQYASIDDVAMNDSGNFTIQQVVGTVMVQNGVDVFRYSITAVSSTQPQTPVAMFAALANTGSPTGLSGSGSSASGSGNSKSSPSVPVAIADPSNSSTGFALNFGVDDDTVGENVAGKYAPITADGVPFEGMVTIKELAPFPAINSIFDVLFSSDFGASWTSMLPVDGKIVITNEAIAGSQDSNFAANPRIRMITNFAGQALKKGWLARLDSLQGAGAQGLEFWIHGQPSRQKRSTIEFSPDPVSPGQSPFSSKENHENRHSKRRYQFHQDVQ